jgi:hypothetical protein
MLIEKLFTHITDRGLNENIFREFGWGDTCYMPGILQRASMRSIEKTSKIMQNNEMFIKEACRIFNLNMELIFRKFVLTQVLYKKYFFYELCLQYCKEHPEESHEYYMESMHLDNYEEELKKHGGLHILKKFQIISYVAGLCGIVIMLLFYWRSKVSDEYPSFHDAIICILTMPDEYTCYQAVFGDSFNIHYVATEGYMGFFSDAQKNDINLKPIGMNSIAYKIFSRKMKRFFFSLVEHAPNLYIYGIDMLRLCNHMFHGRAIAPSGPGNSIFAFEHHDFYKTIRNEFIRSEGSRSIFFPYCAGFALRYYPEEYYQNYDYALSSGTCFEDHLRESGARITDIIKTGSYVAYQKKVKDNDYHKRIQKLLSFKENSIAVTVLCPGVCKPTYHSEVKLMDIAKKLSGQEGVKVYIRKKPFIPEAQYDNFYESFTEGNSSIYLTGNDYLLFDFLPITDLFITTYSTSACDLAMHGANVFFIDVMNNPDRLLFWKKEIVNGLLLSGEEALSRIVEWLNDQQDGPIRRKHKFAMEQFKSYLEYQYNGFDAFRDNILSELKNKVFQDVGVH